MLPKKKKLVLDMHSKLLDVTKSAINKIEWNTLFSTEKNNIHPFL